MTISHATQLALVAFTQLNLLMSALGADDWGLGPFVRPENVNPILRPDPSSLFDCPIRGSSIAWESAHTFNPAAVVKDGEVFLFYRAEDGNQGISKQTSRIGLATSRDGIHFGRRAAPVLYPNKDAMFDYEWPGGCEDPRIVTVDDGTYLMTYSRWDRKCSRLGIATSKDLITWQKHEHAFARAGEGKYEDLWAKSGSIVCRLEGDQLIATKINGKYWMYWGERPIRAATSVDLLHWQPVEDAAGQIKPVLSPRPGHFDSGLTEPGSPALLTQEGILLLYNGKNGSDGDKSIPVRTYAAGEALFDMADPTQVKRRADAPFLKPDSPFEKTGQYAAGTTFVEGLVPFRGEWFLYYGCADSLVGVAVSPTIPGSQNKTQVKTTTRP